MAQITGCTTYRDVTISFRRGGSVTPANGYRIKWKPASSSTWTIVTPNVTLSPYILAQMPLCENLDVCIEAECSPNIFSTETCFVVEAVGDILIQNNADPSSSIDEIIPPWFTASTGSFPIIGGSNLVGKHIAFAGSFTVSVSNLSNGCLVLMKNNQVYMSVPVSGTGVYAFNDVTFDTFDEVLLILQPTSC